jgi:hypothetical protein
VVARSAAGLEVTEFYYSEALARLRNIPFYLKQVMEGRHAHKDDITELPVSTVRITAPDGRDKGEAQAVIKDTPSITTYVDMLREVVTKKSSQRAAYRTDLSHANLIIVDNEEPFYSTERKHIAHNLLRPDLVAALYTSGFREIYLTTSAVNGTCVVVPTLMLALCAEVTVTIRAMIEFGWDPSDDTEVVLATVADLLRERGLPVELLRAGDGMLELVLGGCGYIISRDWRQGYRDHADYVYRGTREEGHPLSRPDGFREYLERFRESNRFEGGFIPDAKSHGG